jgi:thiol-disulfide isomerase/thioredoxin
MRPDILSTMLSISIGPLALPVTPLLLLLCLWGAAALAGRMAGPEAVQAEHAMWTAAGLGLLAARVGHVVGHGPAYLGSPWDMIDLRDGGWFAPAGWVAGGLWLGWRAWRGPALRRALGTATLAGAALWLGGQAALGLVGGRSTGGAPDVTLAELDGDRTLRLPAVLAGQPAVVNLWASWCGPCRAEMPVLAAAQQRERAVRFLFVNQGESPAAVRAYLQREGLALEGVWLDTGSALGPAVGSSGLPTTLFFNARGERVDAHFGVLNAAALQARLERLRSR